MEYLARVADKVLQDYLDAIGTVVIEGPKWCGKTTTASRKANSVISLQDVDKRDEYLMTASAKPSLLLLGETPRLIDEWQDAPVLWDACRTVCDKRLGEPGQFILTGSNAVDRAKITHSGTGRIAKFSMLPMSLWESNESTGEISVKELLNNPDLDIDGKKSRMSIEDLIFAACRGGWPASLIPKTKDAQLRVARSYIKSVCAEDISRIDGVSRDEYTTKLLLKSYARNISTLAKKTTILSDLTSSQEVSCSMDTFDDYKKALEKLFVIQDIKAWCPSIRSKSNIRSAVKRSFCDPSVTAAALGATPDALMTQLRTFGFIFEQMCIRDLKAYTMDQDSHVSHYHDRYDLEVDVVLHMGDGKYVLVECKLGSAEIEEGAQHLLEVRDLIRKYNQTEKQVPLREPDLLVVLTGGTMAYTRNDGVKIIPLACLKD